MASRNQAKLMGNSDLRSVTEITHSRRRNSGEPPRSRLKAIRTCGFAAADFGFHDATDSPPNDFLAVKITTLPAAGVLMFSGAPVTAGQVVPVVTSSPWTLT